MSNVNFSMAVLYTVCRLAWQNCLNNVAVFAARKGFYNAAYIALRMGEIDAAENLPDEQARDDAHETLRVQLKLKAALCRDYWNYLERYIVSAYVKDERKSKIEASGKDQYDQGGETDWDMIALMMSNAYQFILDNSAVLAVNIETGTADNMPAGFAAEFLGIKNDFDTAHLAFLQAEEGAHTGTQTKSDANDMIYDKMRMMLDDGVVYLKNNPALKKQFVLIHLLELVDGSGPGDDLVFEGPINGMQVVNVLNPEIEAYKIGVSLRIKNTHVGPPTGGLFFYFADNANDGWTSMGNQLMPGQEMTMGVSIGTFRPYFNVQNQGPTQQSYEVEIIEA